MAYARFSADSDVYVYADVRGGYVCERCPDVGSTFTCGTALELVAHLKEHVARGERVPDEAFEELGRESECMDE